MSSLKKCPFVQLAGVKPTCVLDLSCYFQVRHFKHCIKSVTLDRIQMLFPKEEEPLLKAAEIVNAK